VDLLALADTWEAVSCGAKGVDAMSDNLVAFHPAPRTVDYFGIAVRAARRQQPDPIEDPSERTMFQLCDLMLVFEQEYLVAKANGDHGRQQQLIERVAVCGELWAQLEQDFKERR
jgi:hypothetical protein